MIIAIDGPAASGKSTTAKNVANELGFAYLDTGSMYRAVTLAIIQKNIDIKNENDLVELLNNLALKIEYKDGDTVLQMDGNNIAKAIRSVDVTSKVSAVSAIPIVRENMVAIQRQLGSQIWSQRQACQHCAARRLPGRGRSPRQARKGLKRPLNMTETSPKTLLVFLSKFPQRRVVVPNCATDKMALTYRD